MGNFKSIQILGTITLALSLSACGEAIQREALVSGAPKPVIGGGGSSNSNSGQSSITNPLTGLLEYKVNGVGYTGTATVQVEAGQRLRLRFVPGTQEPFVDNTHFEAVYSRLGVFIKVGGTELDTGILHNGHAQQQQQSQILDFSGELNGTKQTVTITVSKPNSDYWCLNFPYNWIWDGKKYVSTCANGGYHQMHSTHPWNGTLYVETEDTESL